MAWMCEERYGIREQTEANGFGLRVKLRLGGLVHRLT
jgi:hypothetical protein